MAAAAAAQPGPAHPSADPRDLGGVWWTRGYDRSYEPSDGSPVPFLPWAEAEFKQREALEKAGTPVADPPTRCMPHGVPRIMASPYPVLIMQTPGTVTFLHEVAHNVRHIYLDEAPPADPEKTYLGYSTGRWEGDTLVVETVGLNDRTLIDEAGIPHTDAMRVVERIRKINAGRDLEVLMTVYDDKAFTKPWTMRRLWQWRPDIELSEYVCEENNRNDPGEGKFTSPQ
jgi:hypothetical protein